MKKNEKLPANIKRPGRSADLFQSGVPDSEKLKRSAVAVEDLILFLRQFKIENLQIAMDVLQALLSGQASGGTSSAVARSYQSSDPNKHFLIGALPRLLLDRELFPSNDDIVEFANMALRIDMKVEKRARFEIIGKIVCETDLLDETQLTGLVKALERLVGNSKKIADMVARKKSGSFSWNETLQELLRQ